MLTSQSLCLLTPAQVSEHWGNIEPRLHQIPNFDRDWTPEALAERIVSGAMSIWTIGHDMIVLTSVVEYPKTKAMQVIFAQGTGLDEHLELVWDIFHLYADMKECSRIELFGRPGWFKKLRRFPDVQTEFTVLSTPVRKRSRH